MVRHLPPTAAPLLRPRLTRLKDAQAAFQNRLAAHLGAPCFLASSGRTALFLLLQTLSQMRPARTEVLMPAYTCPALAKVTLDAGLRPCFIDISPQTLALDPSHLEKALSEKTLAAIVVHPFGIPQDAAPVIAQATQVGAFVIEDAAQAMGARWDGQPVGKQGDFGLFSLGPGKALSTGGGGILCVNRPDFVAPLAKAWRQLGEVSPVMNGVAGMRYGLFTAVFYPPVWWAASRLGVQRVGNYEASWGYQLRGFSAVSAAIGLAGLSCLEEINGVRRRNGRQLAAGLQDAPQLQMIAVPPPAEEIYLRFPVLTASPKRREALFHTLQAANVGAGRMYPQTLPQLFSQHGARPVPGAELVAQCLITLPTHHFMTLADQHRILTLLHTC